MARIDPQIRRPRRLRRLILEIRSADPARKRKRRIGLLVAVVSIGSVVAFFAIPREAQVTFPVVPPTVERFSLRDAKGVSHAREEWRDCRAVLVLAMSPNSRKSLAAMPNLKALASRAEGLGAGVFGLVADPAIPAEAVRRMADANGLGFPILLDPAQELSGDCQIASTPEAAVLDPEGHLLYRGAVEVAGRPNPVLTTALDHVLLGYWPANPPTPPVGDPLPWPSPMIDPAKGVTFNRDVAPILRTHCAGCHHAGDVGPFPLLSYRDAAKRAGFLKEMTKSRQMPPWRAEPGHGDFLDQHRLNRREIATIAAWAETGAKEGDPADLAPAPTFPEGWRLGTPDLILSMPKPFAIPAGAKDIYRAFVLPIPGDRDVAISAVEFQPDNKKVVHHARIYVDQERDCRKLDEADPADGFEAFSGGGVIKPGLGAWIPGVVPRFPPEGVGRILKAGSDLILMVHYHGTGKPEVDRSRIGLYFSKTPPNRWPGNVPIATDKIDIPPGTKSYRVAQSAVLPADVHAFSILPHGHFLLRDIRLSATLPDGRIKPLLWIKDWDFNWQGQYYFARPVSLPKGTRLDAVAIYDNSAENMLNPNSPPIRVKYGYASHDEMFGCHLQIIGDTAQDRAIIEKKWPNGL